MQHSNFRDDDKGFAIMSRHQYPINVCRVFERTTSAKIQEALASIEEPDDNEHADDKEGVNTVSDAPKGNKGSQKSGKSTDTNKKNTGSRVRQPTLKVVLGEALGYGPALSEHMILDAGLAPNVKLVKDSKLDDSALQSLVKSVKKFEDWLEDVIKGDTVPEGFILMQQKNLGKDSSTSETQNSNQVSFLDFAMIFIILWI